MFHFLFIHQEYLEASVQIQKRRLKMGIARKLADVWLHNDSIDSTHIANQQNVCSNWGGPVTEIIK